MAIRKIARLGHPILRKKAKELSKKEILSLETERLIKDMVETMKEYGGIGLAAPQIHESLSVALIGFESEPITPYFNAKISVLDTTEQAFWEGCLSIPGLRGLVYRPRKIRVDYLDFKAEPQSREVEGFLATVFQHELDHLAGILYVDRIRFEPGKSPFAFEEEYTRYHIPEADSEIQELKD